jgi:hypothetical protein
MTLFHPCKLHSVEESYLVGCDTVSGCIFPEVLNDLTTSETSGTTHPTQKRHIKEDLNLQQHCCYKPQASHYTVSNVLVT